MAHSSLYCPTWRQDVASENESESESEKTNAKSPKCLWTNEDVECQKDGGGPSGLYLLVIIIFHLYF